MARAGNNFFQNHIHGHRKPIRGQLTREKGNCHWNNTSVYCHASVSYAINQKQQK